MSNINKYDKRPWGKYLVLEDTKTYKVKRIEVNPGGRLSYQYHNKRSEVWTIVKGNARITLDGVVSDHVVGDVVVVPTKANHRIMNIGEDLLIFIEIQLGTYFGEDDIVRIEDDYSRN